MLSRNMTDHPTPAPLWYPGKVASRAVGRIIDNMEARGDLAREYARGRLEERLFQDFIAEDMSEETARVFAACDSAVFTGLSSPESQLACYKAGKLAEKLSEIRTKR